MNCQNQKEFKKEAYFLNCSCKRLRADNIAVFFFKKKDNIAESSAISKNFANVVLTVR